MVNKKNIWLKHILHLTDLSKESEFVFAHAIKLSLLAQAELDILHVGENVDLNSFPQVLRLLERWKVLPRGSNKADILKLGFFVRKIAAPSNEPFSWIMDYLKTNHPDLIVLMTHQKKGLMRWRKKSISEPIARKSKTMTLFMPDNTAGIVCIQTGEMNVKHVLIPITQDPPPEMAINVAKRLIKNIFQRSDFQVTLLYIGEKSDKPKVDLPSFRWEVLVRNGNVVEEILKVSSFKETDLIIMTTKGHEGFLDALRGSTTEQVVRESPVPVLAIPATLKVPTI